ncbi:MAG: flagellar basal-body rod protein FlgG [Hyphomicrobiales bacterium]|nr:flagellar basal-body rod protein FlgG [Rickettsiales bacterium]MCP5361659.1 flagellar basal-body rod protein FlgG [Hyphomicrobiales bacterium]
MSLRAMSIAATGMLAQQLNIDVISNNIANLSTTAYKQQRAEFQDLLYQDERRVGTASSDAGTIVPTGIQVGLGVKPAAVYRITLQGALQQTGNALDIAVRGKGYFRITLPDGTEAYTRAGAFQTDANGQIVTADGYVVGPAVTIPDNAQDITINSAGEVLVSLDGTATASNVGRLELVNFINPAGLKATGDNLYIETEASGTPIIGFPGDDGFGDVQQKFLESSNVDAVKEITSMISAQRAYELNSKVISTSDEMLQQINQIR